MINIMHRTTIVLPEALKARLEKEARRDRVSFGELVRRALQKYLLGRQEMAAHDPFLASHTIFTDEGPADVAEHHDRHLVKDPH